MLLQRQQLQPACCRHHWRRLRQPSPAPPAPPAPAPPPAAGPHTRRRHSTAVAAAASSGDGGGSSILSGAGLPIGAVLQELLQQLDARDAAVLQAPPGAGKTTVVPLAMLAHRPRYLDGGKSIVMLEPRRVAAKAAARRMAALLGEPVGRTVGYAVKLERRVSAATRIEVVTEGILLRRLQRDPGLEGVGAVLLDEFHERNLDGDLALALALDSKASGVAPDLRVLVMSATLGGTLAQELQQLMADAAGVDVAGVPFIRSEGRSFPVATHYLGRPLLQKRGELERATADAVLRALQAPGGAGGDVLAFLPGVAEIKRVQQLLQQEAALRRGGVAVQQLHGSLSPQQQDDVIRPSRAQQQQWQRRVVLSTPIAESSITLDGVTAVVDAGLHRAPSYNPATGISRLVTQRISQDSADQRSGRAGRTQPGVCFRLWERDDELVPCSSPEIATADLAPLALMLAGWGVPDGQGLAWLDAPDPGDLAEAQQLLRNLAAVDDRGSLTDTGRRMATLPAHPRFAHMILRAQQLGAAELGCVLAALLSERDLFRGTSSSASGGGGGSHGGADLTARLRVLAGAEPAPAGYDAAAGQRVLLSAQQMLRQLAASSPGPSSSDSSQPAADGDTNSVSTLDELDEAESSMDDDDASSSSSSSRKDPVARDTGFHTAWTAQVAKLGMVGALVAAAYPDRIAQLKPGASGSKPGYTLSSGRAVALPSATDPLASSQYIAVAELLPARNGVRNDRVTLGAALTPAAIQVYLADEVQERTNVFWASGSKAVLAKKQRVLGSLVLSEQAAMVDDAAALPVLFKALAGGGFASLPVPAAAEAWRARAAWLHLAEMHATGSSRVPDLTAATLMATLPAWLAPHLAGVRSRAQLQRLPWLDVFKSQMSWDAQQHVDAAAPSHLQLPTGSAVPIRYPDSLSQQPTASCKMQEVFGLAATPLLGGDACRVPLVLELLSPAGRPLQVTSSLASFWRESYAAVKKEMRGRYPKHPWPDDPASAAPTRLTKKQAAAADAGGSQGASSSSSSGSKPPSIGLTNKKRR